MTTNSIWCICWMESFALSAVEGSTVWTNRCHKARQNKIPSYPLLLTRTRLFYIIVCASSTRW